MRLDHEVHRLPAAMRRGLAKPFNPGIRQTIPGPPETDLPIERAVGRRVSFRGKGSGRCTSSVVVPAAETAVLDRSESLLERYCKELLLVRSDCYDLHSQVGPVVYRDESGKAREHFIDIVFTDRAGCRTAFLVKPEKRGALAQLEATAKRIAVAAVPAYADDVRVLTNADFSRHDVVNASLFRQFSRFPDPDAEAAIDEAIAYLQGSVCIDALVRTTSYGGRAFREIVKAIFRRKLVRLTGGIIDRWTVVERRMVQ